MESPEIIQSTYCKCCSWRYNNWNTFHWQQVELQAVGLDKVFDGKFSGGNPGAVTYDQSLLIVDSTLFDNSFHDRASYVLGNEGFEFNQPIEVSMAHERDDVAIYRRKNGAIWEELPSISKDGEIFTLSEKAGYFKLGPKTIIVPEQTSIHQNYPNPFNPTTTIMYDIRSFRWIEAKSLDKCL